MKMIKNRKSVWIKVNKTLKWHIEGNIIEGPTVQKSVESVKVVENGNSLENKINVKNNSSLANIIIALGVLCIIFALLGRWFL